jgi:hypothetical protein
MILQILAYCQKNDRDPVLIAWYRNCSPMHIKGKSNCLDAEAQECFIEFRCQKKA